MMIADRSLLFVLELALCVLLMIIFLLFNSNFALVNSLIDLSISFHMSVSSVCSINPLKHRLFHLDMLLSLKFFSLSCSSVLSV